MSSRIRSRSAGSGWRPGPGAGASSWPFHLGDDVLEADQVLLGAVELVLGLPLLVLVIGRAGGFLDEGPLLGRLGGDEVADRALFDDEIFLLADGVSSKLVLDVLEPDGLAVQPVFALARTGRRGGRR